MTRSRVENEEQTKGNPKPIQALIVSSRLTTFEPPNAPGMPLWHRPADGPKIPLGVPKYTYMMRVLVNLILLYIGLTVFVV